jgi:hypothetical protein
LLDDQRSTEQSADQTNLKRDTLKQIFSIFAQTIGVTALLVGIAGGAIKMYEYFYAEPSIGYNFSRYKIAKLAVFSGELINDSSYHAKGLTFKGKFSSKIIDLEVTTGDSIEKKEINNPNGSAGFSLNRLSKKSKCGGRTLGSKLHYTLCLIA